MRKTQENIALEYFFVIVSLNFKYVVEITLWKFFTVQKLQ